MNDYVSKPVHPQALSEMLSKWLPVPTSDTRPKDSDVAASAPMSAELKPSAGGVAVFDRVALLDRLMGDAELAETVLAAFLDDVPRQLGALEGFLADGALAEATRQAHTLKGAAANVGAEALSRAASEIETLGRAGNLPGMRPAVTPLRARFEELCETIQKPPTAGAARAGTEQPQELCTC